MGASQEGSRGCPTGPPGPEGPRGDGRVHAIATRVENVHQEDGKEVRENSSQILYVDRSRDELGIRTPAGQRVFVPLKDVLEILRKSE